MLWIIIMNTGKKPQTTKLGAKKPVDALEAKYKKVGIHAVEAAAKYTNVRSGRTHPSWVERRSSVAG